LPEQRGRLVVAAGRLVRRCHGEQAFGGSNLWFSGVVVGAVPDLVGPRHVVIPDGPQTRISQIARSFRHGVCAFSLDNPAFPTTSCRNGRGTQGVTAKMTPRAVTWFIDFNRCGRSATRG